MMYLITGLCTIFAGPLIGKASDQFGKFPVLLFGTLLSMVMVLIYTNLGLTPFPIVILTNVIMFVGVFSRMIPSQALITAIPAPAMRGSFNAVSASLQQISGGIASAFAGLIVSQRPDGHIIHFNILGYIICCTALCTLSIMYRIHKRVPENIPHSNPLNNEHPSHS
jgi:predicted MFS family arabinose efflux permease